MQLLIDLSVYLINVFIAHLSIQKMKKVKVEINLRVIAILWVCSLMILMINYIQGDIVIIKPVLSFLIFSFMCSVIYNKPFFEHIGEIFLFILVMFLSEIFYSLVLAAFQINFSVIVNSIYGLMLTNLIIEVSGYLVILFFMKKAEEKFSNVIKTLNTNKSKIIFVIIILLMGILTVKNIYFNLNFGYLFNLLLILIFLVIIYLLFVERRNKEKLSCEQEILYNYIIKYEKELIEKSKIIHDFKNELLIISGLASNKDIKMKEYLSELLNDIRRFDANVLEKLNKVPVGGLKGLFYYKFLDIEKSNIKLTLDIDDNLSKIEKIDTVMYKNLVKLLGIYLDNAIEASKKSKEKELEIEIFTKDKTINFVISNTYCNTIEKSKLGNAGYSSKGKNRGYGLALANDILGQSSNIIETKDISNNIYSVFLIIKI